MMSDTRVVFIEEPSLQFGCGQDAADPHDGLSLYGPFNLDRPGHPVRPPHVVIGTRDGIELWKSWSEAINKGFAVSKKDRKTGIIGPGNFALWTPYPGYEAAFGARWEPKPLAEYELSPTSLSESSRKHDVHQRCSAVVQHYLDLFPQIRKLDTRPSIAICVVPDEVYVNCRPESRISKPSDKATRRGKSTKETEIDQFANGLAPDFRRQLKARVMAYELPVQIIRESTLRLDDENKFGKRGLTPISDRMWNLTTCLYYKTGGKPWRLNSARPGVSYVGIAFRKTPDKEGSACCVAQMFLDSGDGIVFLGDEGPWYSPEDRQYHLTKESAKKLLSGVIATYASTEGYEALHEIFLHCRSEISDEEYAGYQEACPENCKLIAVRVRRDPYGPRLFRVGRMPVLRGTTWILTKRAAYLYASGFKERLETYDGWETPVPLRIDIQHGEADILQVCKDILGLTKLNYNACKLGESQPVTVGFSDQVGEILLSNPGVKDTRPNFKYYI